MTEKVHPGGAALEQAEEREWVELEEEEWTVQGRGQGQRENVSVPSAARLCRMRLEFLATIGSAPNVGKRWSGNS